MNIARGADEWGVRYMADYHGLPYSKVAYWLKKYKQSKL